MTNIVAEVSQEVQEIFQDLTGDASVSIADIEDRVSTVVDSWSQRLSESILSETASSTEGIACECIVSILSRSEPSVSVPWSQLHDCLWCCACAEMGV